MDTAYPDLEHPTQLSPRTGKPEPQRVARMDGHMQVRPMPGLGCPPTRVGRKPTFEVEEEGEPIGHHGTLAAHHAVAQECLRVSAQGL